MFRHLLSRRARFAWATIATFVASSAYAGVPFVTDDPGSAEEGHYEIDVAATHTHRQGESSGTLPTVEVHYGLKDEIELHVAAPLAYDRVSGDTTKWGIGDVELGVKYRFIEADEGGWRPAVAFAPTVTLPTGDNNVGLGEGHTKTFLPLWASEDFAEWTVFGGGGYRINPGEGNKNSWFTGLGVTNELSPAWTVGGEIFRETKDAEDGRATVGFNLGAIYNFSDYHHLLMSAGKGLRNATETNQFSYYIGYQLTF